MKRNIHKNEQRNEEDARILTTSDKIQLSFYLSKLLKRLSYTLPHIESKIFAHIRTMTAPMYWFIIDSFYFCRSFEEEFIDIHSYRILSKTNPKIKNNHSNHSDEIEEELEFMEMLKQWVSGYKNTLNLEDIRQTPINQLIQIAENNFEIYSDNIDQEFEHILKRANEERAYDTTFFQKHYGNLQKSHQMFIFDEIEDYVCENWMKKAQVTSDIPKCYICSQGQDLIECQGCSLKVHQRCYPTIFNKKQKQKKVPTKIGSFKCQNCRLELDGKNTICELCCCFGGYFVKYTGSRFQQKDSLEHVEIDDMMGKAISQLLFKVSKRQKQKYIHLSCLLWNPQCQWDYEKKEVVSISKIQKKKLNSLCSYCGISFGASVPCTNQTCRRFYHPQCARRNELQMNYITAKTLVIELFCNRHRHLRSHQAIQQAHTNKFRQTKKLFELIQKQIKRQNLTAPNPILKQNADNTRCSICKQTSLTAFIDFCKKCKRWFHRSCASSCQYCS